MTKVSNSNQDVLDDTEDKVPNQSQIENLSAYITESITLNHEEALVNYIFRSLID